MNANTRPILLIAALLLLLTPGSASAACTSPEGVEGEIVYNGPYKTVQFCDGGNWVSMSGTLANETDPKVGTLTADLWCAANAAGTAIECNKAAPATNAAGTVAGAVQFRGSGGGFAADDVNLVWDDTNKRLGIGTATPTHPLTIAGYSGLRIVNTTAGNSTYTVSMSGVDAVHTASSGSGTFSFANGGGTRLFIDGSGNVGIGTTTPGAKLAPRYFTWVT